MDPLLTEVNWVAVLIGTVLSLVLGNIWYAQGVFGKKWMEGKGTAVKNWPMPLLLAGQVIVTFIYAWTLTVAIMMDSLHFALLIAFSVTGYIKLYGYYGGKTRAAIAIEAGYVFATSIIIIAVSMFF